MGVLTDYIGYPLRILLVEPDLDIQTEMNRAVAGTEGECSLVTVTADETEAQDLLTRFNVDCVFLADNLTRRPWPQVVQEILAAAPALRVVLWTEHPSPRLDTDCQRHGVRRMIRKHVDAPTLLHQLEMMLEDERRRKAQLSEYGEPEPGWERGSTITGAGPAYNPVRRPSRVFVFASGYAGGAGKTTALCNLAIRLGNHPLFPARVAVMDLEKGRGSVRVLFDPRMPPKPGILDFAEWAGDPSIPPETLRGMLPRDTLPAKKYHLTTVFGPGSYEREAEVTEPLVSTVLTSLRLEHDFVLVDLPGDVTDAAVAAMRMATTVIWMVRADVKDLERHADILALLRRTGLDTSNFRAVISLVPEKLKPPFSPEQIQKGLGFPLLTWALPYDPKVAMAVPDEFAAVKDPRGAYMTALDHVIAQLCPDLGSGGSLTNGRPKRRGRLWIFGGRK